MRRLIGAFVMAMSAALAAQPAHAADGSFGFHDLIVASSIAPAITPAATTATATISPIASPDFRLHALIDVDAPKASILDAQTGRLRRGFGAAMMDFFPRGGDGFHVSAGSRFYNRMARTNADAPYAQLLYAPRSVLARATRRMTPALTFGYTKLVQNGMSLGIEGGAMIGKFDSLAGSLVRIPRLRGEGVSDGGRLNQIARLTFGYRF